MGDSNAGESLFITCPVPLTPSLGPGCHLTRNKLHRPTLGPSLSCSNFPAASLTHLLPSGPSQAEPGTQQARSRPRAFAQLFSPPGVCFSKYPPDRACSSSSCSRMSSPQRGLPGTVSLLYVTGWMLNPLPAVGVEAHTLVPITPGLAGGSGQQRDNDRTGWTQPRPLPSRAPAGLSRTPGGEAGCEGQQARTGSWLFPRLQPALAKRSRWCRALAGAPWLTSLAMILGPLHLSARRRHFKAPRRGL